MNTDLMVILSQEEIRDINAKIYEVKAMLEYKSL